MSISEPHLEVSAHGSTDVGCVREHNEDVVLVDDTMGLFVVADGAGGHQAGEVAAQLACDGIFEYFQRTETQSRHAPEFDKLGISNGARRLSAALHLANRRVLELSKNSDRHKGMGATIVAASYDSRHETLHVAHVGDSRCYRLRQSHLELLTQDHSLLTDVLEQRPELDEAKLKHLPKNVVTRALGMGPTLRVSLRSHRVVGGDRYLLCSDGLSGVINTDQIATLLEQTKTAPTIVNHLIQLSKQCGAPDNIAALVLNFEGPSERTLPASRARWKPTSPRESDPELLILGIEDLDLAQHLYTTSDGLLEQLGKLGSDAPPKPKK